MLTPCYIPDPSQAGAVRPPVAGWFARAYGATGGYFGLKCPAVGPNVDWTMPGADGSNGQLLQTNGGGTLSWGSVSVSGFLVQAPANNAANTVQPTGVSVVPFTIKQITSQTSDFVQFQNSSGVRLVSIDKDGNVVASGLTGAVGGGSQYIGLGSANELLFWPATDYRISIRDTESRAGAGMIRGWSSNNNPRSAAADVGLARNAAGVLEINNGTAGAFADLKVANVTLADAKNLAVGTTTGTKIGTSSAQKLGFFGAAPVPQQLKASHNNWAALADVVSALVNLGLVDAV